MNRAEIQYDDIFDLIVYLKIGTKIKKILHKDVKIYSISKISPNTLWITLHNKDQYTYNWNDVLCCKMVIS